MGILRIKLGYTDDQPDPVLTADRQSMADDILAKLDLIDSQLDAALPDSMAQSVGDLKVDYSQHIGLLRSAGSRLLRQLARVSLLAVQYDPYTGRSPSTSAGTNYVVNYW